MSKNVDNIPESEERKPETLLVAVRSATQNLKKGKS